MYKRILVAVDGSSTSNTALLEAVNLAKDQGAGLKIVHVVDTTMLDGDIEGYMNFAALQEALHQAGGHVLQRAATLTEENGLQAESALLEAAGTRVARVLEEEANHWKADLIVIGTHGRRGLDHMLLGSVAEDLVRIAPVPVLLVRSR